MKVIQTSPNKPKSLAVLAGTQPEDLQPPESPEATHPGYPKTEWYCDPQKALHRALGLGKTGWLAFFHPRVLGSYLGSMVRGFLPNRPAPGEDLLQLGGDFFWDKSGKMVWSFRSREPTDRPSEEEIRGVFGTWCL